MLPEEIAAEIAIIKDELNWSYTNEGKFICENIIEQEVQFVENWRAHGFERNNKSDLEKSRI